MDDRIQTDTAGRLRMAGLRPTRQRLALAGLLFDGPDRHVTAEALHADAARAGVRVSLATIYNALNQFTGAGLLRQIVVDGQSAYFDTNRSDHQHFFNEDTGQLEDIALADLALASLPVPPEGTEISRVDVVIRVRNRGYRSPRS
ncbi:MAG: Fur family transcriptional regulator [Proteobacteria bacterium]|nr:Fur family transcriptional regulator [Pseudomonadota bacterium]